MTHLDEATLVALRDREDVPPEAIRHMGSCAWCAEALEDATVRERKIEEMLSSLDEEGMEREAARVAVRARLDREIERRAAARPWWRPAHLGRAAAVLLVAAGAVAALPGSPVREWIAEPAVTATGGDTEATASQEAEPSAVTVPVDQDGLQILVSSLGPLAELEVVWIGGAAARVEAPAGSRFTYAAGRVEALVAGGPVRVELPRAGGPLQLEVDGTPYLTRSGDGLRVEGPVGDRSDERILFVAP